jgi:diaminopimelate epimerase
MQGVGNDFVVLDAATLALETDWPLLAMRLCERHFGVGADGLLVVSQDANNAAFAMRMFNPDGTEDMCGNGLRCVCLWAYRAGWLAAVEGPAEFIVATKDGPHRCRLTDVSPEGREGLVRVGMDRPRFMPPEIPFCAPGRERIVDSPLPVGDRTYTVTSLNTGSTHTVIFGDAPDEATFQRDSPLIENHPLFPERTSVLWATPMGTDRFAVRIWERGAGETLGCGTGACAVGVAARLHGFVSAETPTAIVSRGGTLLITWPGDETEIQMLGPAQFVFEGETSIAAS